MVIGVNYNLPKLCPNATWNASAITFANSSIISVVPLSVIVNKYDTVFSVNRVTRRIVFWRNESSNSSETIPTFTEDLRSLFAMENNGIVGQQSRCPAIAINHWSINGTSIGSYSIPYITGEFRCRKVGVRLTIYMRILYETEFI
jgi:hypothetical protein